MLRPASIQGMEGASAQTTEPAEKTATASRYAALGTPCLDQPRRQGRTDDGGHHEQRGVPGVVLQAADVLDDAGQDGGGDVDVDGVQGDAAGQRDGTQRVGAMQQVGSSWRLTPARCLNSRAPAAAGLWVFKQELSLNNKGAAAGKGGGGVGFLGAGHARRHASRSMHLCVRRLPKRASAWRSPSSSRSSARSACSSRSPSSGAAAIQKAPSISAR